MCQYCRAVPCNDIKTITFFDNGQPQHIEFFRHDVIDAQERKPELSKLSAEIDNRWATIMEMVDAKKLESTPN